MQNEREDVVFGTSAVGGFNRQNVLDYIEKLQNRLAQCETAAQTQRVQLQQMQAQMHTLQDALSQANAVNGDLQTQLDAARLEARQARAEAERLRSAHVSKLRGKK